MRLLPCLILLGCPAPDDTDPPAPEDLSVTLPANGPYGVGYQEETIAYDAGAACAGTGAGTRSLRLAVWYPTEDTSGEEAAYQGFFPAPGVLDGATRAPGAFPLVVYSHGSRGYAEASGRQVAHLVSHGFVVASADHTDNTFLDGDTRTTAIYWQRPHDVGAVLDHVLDPSHPVAAPLSSDPILAMGHSFGGYTLHALAGATYDASTMDGCSTGDTSPFCSTMTTEQRACFEAGFRDDRIAGIISMASGDSRLFGQAGLEQVQIPVLHITGGLDDVEEGARIWAGFDRAGNVRVNITDAGHNAFADAAPGLDNGPQYIDAELGWSILGAYQLAWIRNQLGDATTQPVLDGTLVFGDTTEVEPGG